MLAKSASSGLPHCTNKVETWAMICGVQDVWGEENVPENERILPKIFGPLQKNISGLPKRGLLYRKSRATTLEGCGKRTRRRGSKTLFGRGLLREVFLPIFFPPPMASSKTRQPLDYSSNLCPPKTFAT